MSDSFFVRKKGKGVRVPDPGAYDLTNEDDCIACGLDQKDFQKRNHIMFNGEEGFGVEDGHNPVASISARLEQYFSKREIAFLLAKEMLKEVMRRVQQKEENGK